MAYKNTEDRKIYVNNHYQKYKEYYKKKAAEWTKIYNKRNKKFVNRIKSIFGCQKCAYKKCLSALEFHHLDGDKKDKAIGNLINSGSSLKRLKKELRKCILLCSNCHREEHSKCRVT